MKSSLLPFAAGTLGGCLFVAALLFFDISGIGTLILRDQAAMLALVMLLLQIGGMFGVAVWLSSLGSEPRPQGHRAEFKPALAVRRPRSPNR
jgi:hypothetical protein